MAQPQANPFKDLVPKENPFKDLAPKKEANPFSDLVPQKPSLLSRAGEYLGKAIPEFAGGAIYGALNLPQTIAAGTPPYSETGADILLRENLPATQKQLGRHTEPLPIPESASGIRPTTMAGEIGALLGNVAAGALFGEFLPKGVGALKGAPLEEAPKEVSPFEAPKTVYRRGHPDGGWWSSDEGFVKDIRRPKEPIHQAELPADAKILDTIKNPEIFDTVYTSEEKAKLAKLNITTEERNNIYNAILERTGHDAIKFSEGRLGGKVSDTYYVKPGKLRNIAPTIPTTSTVGPKEYMPKYAGSINLERLDIDEQAKKLILEESKKIPQKKMSPEEIKAEAAKLNWTPEDVINLPKGKVLTDVEITAARQTHINETAGMIKDWNTDDPNRFDRFKQRAELQATVATASREISSSLRAHQIILEPIEPAMKRRIDAVDRIMKAKPNADQAFIDKIMSEVANENNPARMEKLVYSMITSPAQKGADIIREAYINFLISAPRTWFKVHLSQGLFSVMRPVLDRPAAYTVDTVLSLLKGTPKEVLMGEAIKDMQGLIQGVPTALKYGLMSLKEERQVFTQDVLGRPKFYQPAIPSIGKFPLGRIVRFPGAMIGAPDDAIKAWNYHANAFTEAWSQAVREGLKGDELENRIHDLMLNDERIRQVSSKDSMERAFQRPLSKFMQQVREWRDKIKFGYFIDPFLTIMDSYLRTAYERGPLIYPELVKDIWLNRLSQRELSMKLGKATTGTLIGGLVGELAHHGYITGAPPREAAKRNTLLASGWRPYHYRIGKDGPWHSYLPVEVIAPEVGLAATMFQEYPGIDKEDTAAKIGHAFGAAILEKTFVTGVSRLLDAITDPARYAKQEALGFAGSIVPNIVARGARTVDPTVRKPQTVTEQIESRIPWLSKNIKPLRDIWGKPVIELGSPAERMFSPFTVSPIIHDRATDEVIRLGINIGMPLQKIGHLPMDSDEYDKFQEEAGDMAHRAVTKYVESSAYESQPDFVREKNIRRIDTMARDRAKQDILLNYLIPRYKKYGVRTERDFLRMEKGIEPVPKALTK